MSGTTTSYLYDGLNPVQEQNASGSPTANEITDGGDQTFWRNDLGNGTVRSLLTDGLGSTVAGQQTTTLGSTETNPFQYTGREWDGATGLQFNRARYYNPTFGRFSAEDQLDIMGGGANLYEYAGDNPFGATDALGLSSCSFSCWVVARISVLLLDILVTAGSYLAFGLALLAITYSVGGALLAVAFTALLLSVFSFAVAAYAGESGLDVKLGLGSISLGATVFLAGAFLGASLPVAAAVAAGVIVVVAFAQTIYDLSRTLQGRGH